VAAGQQPASVMQACDQLLSWYSIEKGHDIGWSVMACELVGVAGFEPAASSSRTSCSAGCLAVVAAG